MKPHQLALAALRASATPDTIQADVHPHEGDMPALAGATGWLNSRPLAEADLRGHVVLVDFWTYTCINWLRTLPYIRAWAQKYNSHGLVVLGVHSPEFSFEGDVANVQRAVATMGITYPVAVDSDHAIWRAFDNAYWPALYFVDHHRHIRHHYFGEGEYSQSEMVIQRMLRDAGAQQLAQNLVSVDGTGPEATADWGNLWSPENYLGMVRTENFASPEPAIRDRAQVYSDRGPLPLNAWSASGDWTMGREAAVLNEANGRITYRFHARDLHLVMGPARNHDTVRFRVLVDQQPPGDAHGSDVDAAGFGVITEQRLHQLIRQPPPIIDRQFEIEFLDPGVAAYAFTFG